VGQLLSQAAGDTFTFGKYAFWRTANFLASYSSSLDNRLLHLINIEDLIDTSPLTQLLDRVLDAAVVRNSAKKLRITTTDWVSGKALVFGNEDFVGEKGNRAVSASTAIPGIFPPVEIGCSLCVDGGVVQNTPLNPAIQLGATELHVIALNPEPQDVALSGEPNTIDTMMRVYFMLLAGKLNEDIETARWINQGLDVFDRAEKGGQIGDLEVTRVLRMVGHKGPLGKPLRKVVIHKYLPSTSLGGDLSMLNFDREQVIKMIQLGENEALTHDCEACRCVLD
jgi:predicted acylesterase/phospholipase RssA